MLSDAASLWKSARQAVGNTVEKMQSNLSNALADLDGAEDAEALESELVSYKEQLLEAQMQHVELSKQLRLMLAEKDAEITVLKNSADEIPGDNKDKDKAKETVSSQNQEHANKRVTRITKARK